MAIGSINSNTVNNQNYDTNSKVTKEVVNTTSTTKVETDTVEISQNNSRKTDTNYKQNTAAVKRAIAEADAKYASMKNLVEKLFKKQGKTGIEADWDMLAKVGKLGDALKNVEVDEKTKLQAQKDISEDGYWGVKKTSERILEFAKALTGGDPSKADKMLNAFKKGFQSAVGAFGGKDKMPDISNDTYNAVIKGFEDWKNGNKPKEEDVMSNQVGQQITGQGSTANIAK